MTVTRVISDLTDVFLYYWVEQNSVQGREFVPGVSQRDYNHEQANSLYKQWKSVVLGGGFVAVSVTMALWQAVDKLIILTWFFIYIAFQCCRALSCLSQVKKAKKAGSDTPFYTYAALNQNRLFSFVNGFVWGALPLIAFSHEFSYFSIAMVIHGGYMAAAVAATASYDLKSFYAFVVPASLIWAMGTLLQGGSQYLPHALLVLFFPLVMRGFARRLNKAYEEQISLRLRNANLNIDLRAQRDKAENAMLEKNRFLAAASHDLRQPVHALGLFVASLEPRLVEVESKQLISHIKQTTENLGSLFHSLLDLSKLDARVVENNPRHFRLQPMIDNLYMEYRELAETKGVDIDVHCTSDVVCFADPSLLDRILRNFMSNAINYTHHGSVVLNVLPVASDFIVIECIDTGKGIPETELENIFSEYHQLENPERDRKKGLGLGLAIVRRLANLMDVKVNVSSTSGVGSTFSVQLRQGSIGLVPEHAKQAVESKAVRFNILVVDDEIDILMGMRSLLTSWGSTVITATSGAEALELLIGNHPPDIIVADFRLRNHESGLDVIDRIRDEYNNPDLAAVLITGDTGAERLQEAVHSGVQVLHKPVDPEQLKAFLSSSCDARVS